MPRDKPISVHASRPGIMNDNEHGARREGSRGGGDSGMAIRSMLKAVYAATVWLALGSPAVLLAQSYPVKPIRIFVSSFGSGPDIMARLIGQKLTEAWGQQVVVDSRVGASGRIAAEYVARSAPDGYTLMIVTSQYAIVTAMYEKPTYDPTGDFAPIVLMASTPFVLVVHPSVPVKSVKELIALAKARPGQIHAGSGGTGSPVALALQRLKSMTGTDMLHVPYKTIAQSITDTVAGQIHLTFGVVPAVLPIVRQGRLRGLGVTSLKRTPLAPELPPIAEAGVPGYEVIGWYGLVAPARTPVEIIAKLNGEVQKALQSTEMHDRLTSVGADAANASTPHEFASYLKAQIEFNRQLIKESGAQRE